MEMKYFVEKLERLDGVCSLMTLMGVRDEFELAWGVSRARGWPGAARFEMNKKHPKDIRLADFLWNMSSLIVASLRVKELLEAEKVKGVEYLPVSIVNLKGRKEKAPYFLVNPVGLVDCIDVGKSRFTKSAIDPEEFMSVRKLVINPSRIRADARLFRMHHYLMRAVWREDLARAVTAQKLTGISFVPPAKFSD